MIKKILKIFLVTLIFLAFLGVDNLNAQVEESEVTSIYFFYSKTCPHCHDEFDFLTKIRDQYDNLEINSFEVSQNESNRLLFEKVAKAFNQAANGVPFTVISDQTFVGFSETLTGPSIVEEINNCIENGCDDFVKGIIDPKYSNHIEEVDISEISDQKLEDEFSIPILGSISARDVSLPLLTLVMGFVDGFNPCAMWVLLFLISMLVSLEDQKRRWILGIVFIVTSASVYFMFMSLWLNLLLFLGFVIWVRIIIGTVSLLGGLVSIKKGIEKTSGCSVTGGEKKQKILERMKHAVHKKNFFLALVGIMILAFSVNLIELICSAGLPAVYTQILAINNLTILQYYLYIFLYVLVFMLDDLVIFILAMKTLEITGMTTKYSRVTKLIGGFIMVIVGILLLFKPDLIMFG
jgi:thiol-disulfide isomerase/thioredoxin